MQKTFLFLDHYISTRLFPSAWAAKKMGLHASVIIPKEVKASFESKLAEQPLEAGGSLFGNIIYFETSKETDVRTAIHELEKTNEIIGIFCNGGFFDKNGCFGELAGRIAIERGLPVQGTEALIQMNNKFLMRDHLATKGLQKVLFGHARNISEAIEHANNIGYPLILKPLTGAGSTLIMKCSHQDELVENFDYLQKNLRYTYWDKFSQGIFTHHCSNREKRTFDLSQDVLIESYIPGPEVSVELYISNKRIIPIKIHDKMFLTEERSVFFEHLLVHPCVQISKEHEQQLINYAVEVTRSFDIDNCFCHVEMRYSDHGPELIEINPRIGGGLVAKSISESLREDPAKIDVELRLGEIKNLYTPQTPLLHQAMAFFYPRVNGVLNEIKGLSQAKKLANITSLEQTIPNNMPIKGKDSEVFLVQCWLEAESWEEIEHAYKQCDEYLQIDVCEI